MDFFRPLGYLKVDKQEKARCKIRSQNWAHKSESLKVAVFSTYGPEMVEAAIDMQTTVKYAA